MTIKIEEAKFGSELYKKLLEIRYEVLRKPIGMELREKDIASDNIEYHIAALDNDKVIGCVLLKPLDADRIQLRQMAIVDTHQGKGIGAKVVTYAEKLAFKKGFKIMETKARKTAQGFYEKLGYMPIEGTEGMFSKLHTLQMSKSLLD